MIRPRRVRALAACLVLAAVGSNACAGVPKHKYIHKAGSGPIELMEGPLPWGPAGDDLPARMADAVRDASRTREARPRPETIEVRDRSLRDALQLLAAYPEDAGAHLRVGWAYRTAGVADRAYDHFEAALRLDERLAGAYDGRARTWRDWGFAALALGDASRAVFHAPHSAAAHNTLGTVLFALGNCRDARQAFSKAMTLDPGATYARENLALVARSEAAERGGCHRTSN